MFLEYALTVCVTVLICIAAGMIAKAISNAKEVPPAPPQDLTSEIQEITRCNSLLQQSVEKVLYQMDATGKLSESQHYEIRQILSLLGQQVQNLSAVIHQLSGAFGNRSHTNNINVQTGDSADNDNTQAGQIHD